MFGCANLVTGPGTQIELLCRPMYKNYLTEPSYSHWNTLWLLYDHPIKHPYWFLRKHLLYLGYIIWIVSCNCCLVLGCILWGKGLLQSPLHYGWCWGTTIPRGQCDKALACGTICPCLPALQDERKFLGKQSKFFPPSKGSRESL